MMRYKLHLLLHSADLIDEQLRIELAALGIKPRQARVLSSLNRLKTASQVELAREFNVTPASMSTMTSRLIAAGYISRKPDPEAPRSNQLKLTRKGDALVSDIRATWAKIDTVIEDAIGLKKAQELAQLTEELRDALGGWVPGTKPSAK